MSKEIDGVAFWVCLLLLILFCAGDPDLLDAIIHCLMK